MAVQSETDPAIVIARLGFKEGFVVQEFGYDDDVDLGLREEVERLTGSELAGEDVDDVTDAALLWWRSDDGDAHDLTDLVTDATVTLEDGGLLWVLTPKTGSAGHVPPGDLEEAAATAGMNTTTIVPAGDWIAHRFTARGRGR
ncbi:DUF3052 domain-containing protein [Pseudactinotalea sp. HY158]|uniref:DUF3052 domain-containing protein n=1 Tax=unclassified Pseudactinotalea TaxID=2649176 RepID=UPI00129CADE6|nr:DUF3052 domain-containing protein [Pseudactinotalea sp. HY158]MPV49802.1 DUF3052 family protein [Pseudactinotalea sp. HY160]QGH69521.1 DUF3052 family protein [Pseudactinotalea sp. HY158]